MQIGMVIQRDGYRLNVACGGDWGNLMPTIKILPFDRFLTWQIAGE